MPYVPGCTFDLFISYATKNNRDGWIEQFENALGQELGDLLGRQFNAKESIFFDKRDLEVAQSFPEELTRAAQDSAILIPVLSPGYLTSPWCNRERTEFFKKLPHGAVPPACLAPILIRPIEEAGLDKLYRDAQRISFLSSDKQTPLAARSDKWVAQLRELARQLRDALQNLRRSCNPVFLGKAPETARAQKLRLWCRSELEHRHFRTVPEFLPALDDSDGINENLGAAGLALHFLGGADAAAMEAIEASMDICMGLTILYQPFGVDLLPAEGLWLDDLERQLPTTSGRYQRLCGKNDQELFALVDEHLARVPASDSDSVQSRLGLVSEEPDLGGVRQLKEEIRSMRGITVDFPEFLGSRLKSMERLRKWQDFLCRSDALLFYHGAVDRERLERIWQTAEQHKPKGRREWFLAPPDIETKRRKHPDALSTLDEIIHFVEHAERTQGGYSLIPSGKDT